MMQSFETKIAKDLYWVPVSALGGANYSIADLQIMAELSTEEKKNNKFTLLDAINFYRICAFQESQDVIYLTENNGKIWEHHKPGYYSVMTNQGCCSSSASWLAYILEGNYERMGLLSYIRPNKSGHCINYIYHQGWYYFIDMSLQIDKYRSLIAKETGKIIDYLNSKPFANIFLKTRNMEAYVDYISKYQRIQNRTFLFSACECSFAPPISLSMEDDRLHVLYPATYNIQILNDVQGKGYTYEFVSPPKKYPSWNI